MGDDVEIEFAIKDDDPSESIIIIRDKDSKDKD
jgi:hypothetical protein